MKNLFEVFAVTPVDNPPFSVNFNIIGTAFKADNNHLFFFFFVK